VGNVPAIVQYFALVYLVYANNAFHQHGFTLSALANNQIGFARFKGGRYSF
jgi:hypothetical protein